MRIKDVNHDAVRLHFSPFSKAKDWLLSLPKGAITYFHGMHALMLSCLIFSLLQKLCNSGLILYALDKKIASHERSRKDEGVRKELSQSWNGWLVLHLFYNAITARQ
jgi:hypothetical protein